MSAQRNLKPVDTLFDLHERWIVQAAGLQDLECDLSDWKLLDKDPAARPAAEERCEALKQDVDRLVETMMTMPLVSDVDLAVMADVALYYDVDVHGDPHIKAEDHHFSSWIHLAKVARELMRRAPSVRFYSIEGGRFTDEQRQELFGSIK